MSCDDSPTRAETWSATVTITRSRSSDGQRVGTDATTRRIAPSPTFSSVAARDIYATSPDIDHAVMEAIRARGAMDLVTALTLNDWDSAARLLHSAPSEMNRGALHLMAKRNDVAAVKWLLDHGADPNARWPHWDADVTPLHLAACQGHAEVVRLLLSAGADPTIHDSKHDGDALGWAEFAGQLEIVRILKDYGRRHS